MNSDFIPYRGNKLAGVDEVGRGPLAGPVVASAVIINKTILGLTDSKKLSEKKRKEYALMIKEQALCYSIARVEQDEIDRVNIFQATMLAMKRAVDGLAIQPEFIAVDGNKSPNFTIQSIAIVKGDQKIACISAASILAKVYRDNLMDEFAKKYPEYGFEQHKGYPTKQHMAALLEHGPCELHRISYAPVKRLLDTVD
jgi:ribonuclease HII